MIRSTVWMTIAALMLTCPFVKGDDILPLKLLKWLPVEGPANNQPSDLAIRDGTLYTVSDKHDSVIFEIKIEEEAAILRPAVVFPDAAALSDGKLDLEGITCDRAGNFYLVSEARFRVLRVDPKGKNVAWVTPSLRKHGEAKGMFRVHGAYFEGITHIGVNRLVLCAEREPRGLIELTLDGDGPDVEAYTRNESKFTFPKGRPPDFAGLWWDGGALYALERNAHLICKMTRGEDGYEEEGSAWSYESIVTSDELRYASMRFGKAEGMCMDDDRVYVIIDNNGGPRHAHPEDRRPMLLIMARPKTQETPGKDSDPPTTPSNPRLEDRPQG